MIILQPAYVLSTGSPAYLPRIGYQTWPRDLGRVPADIVVSSETPSGPKDPPLRSNTYEFWQASALPATWRIDLGAAKDVDYVGIAGHTLGDEAATLAVHHSPDDVVWIQFGTDISPANNAPILILDAKIPRRYWRITLTGVGEPPQIAVIYIGQVLEMPRGLSGGHRPGPLSRDTRIFGGTSEGGNMLGRTIRSQGVLGSAAFRSLNPGFYRDTFDRFVKSARKHPFFFAWSPLNEPNEIIYAATDEDIRPDRIPPGKGLVSVAWEMRGEGHGD